MITRCFAAASALSSAVFLAGVVWTARPAAGADTAAPIADAAELRDVKRVRSLLDDGGDVKASQADGMTALHWAVYHDEIALARRLLAEDADPEAANRYGVRPLSIACQNGNGKLVEMLLQAGADPNTTLPGGETALMTAARTGRIEPVQALLARGAKADASERQGQTALMWAAADGHVAVVDALLTAGADPRRSLGSGFNSLFFSVREGRTAVALRLLEAGLEIDAPMHRAGAKREGPNPLILAVENGHFETAVALLEAGADPNAQPDGFGALHAISWVRKPIRGDGDPPPVGSGEVGALELVRRLVEYGADVDIRLAKGKSGFADFTTTGSSPLVLAARTGDLPLMETLLELGADPSITNADGSTALLAAAGIGDLGSGQQSAGSEEEAIAAVERLLQLGLDVNAVDDNGETAVHGATYQNWPDLIRFLAERGADVEVWNRPNRWGWTPLLIAHGYRKGNFRPDTATIQVIEQLMREAGLVPIVSPEGVRSNQQAWDKQKPQAATKKPEAGPSEVEASNK